MADTIGKANPFLYRGYCNDSETGLYSLNSRYYDPQTGRFLNADGAVSTGTGILGHNMFAYCNNDPTGLADAKLGKAISKLPKYITKIKRVGPGVGFYTRSTSSAFFKSFAKIGIVAAGAFIWDLYTDSMAYRGNDFYKAATVSTIAFAIGISVGLLATGAGMPAGTALLAEVLTGTATGILEGPIKNSGLATEIERVVL
jgi:RHS repeat-associated protein